MLNDTDGTLSDIENMANNPELSKAPDSSDGEGKGNDAREQNNDDKEPSSMEEAVQQALEARVEAEKDEDSSDSDAKVDEEQPDEDSQLDEEGKKKEPVDDDKQDGEKKDKEKDDDSRFDKHPRWQEMQRKVTEMEPLAKWAKNDMDFRQKYGIEDGEHKELMEFAALMHANPEEALTRAKGFVEKMELSLGKVLPKDLQADVDEGKIPLERAKEIANLRLQREAQQVQMQRTEQKTQQSSNEQIVSSLNQWDTMVRRKDADFKPKAEGQPDGKFELVFKEIQLLAMQNPPRSSNEAVAIAEKAYENVNALFKRFSPPPRSRRNISSQNGSFSTSNGKAPTSLREAVAQTALRKHGLRFVSENED